jgi:hypothetical protein
MEALNGSNPARPLLIAAYCHNLDEDSPLTPAGAGNSMRAKRNLHKRRGAGI